MEQLTLAAAVVPEEIISLLRQTEGQTLVAALALNADGRLVVQPLPQVDPLVIPRVLKSMAQYEEVLRRLS